MAESVDAPVASSVVVANSAAVSTCARISLSNVEQTHPYQESSSFKAPDSNGKKTFADTMEGYLIEDCTAFKLVPSLETMATRLKSTANHHEQLVAVSIVIMSEAGFRVHQSERRRVEGEEIGGALDPANWRSHSSDDISYQLRFEHASTNKLLDCKLVAIPLGDVLIINLCPVGLVDVSVTRTRCVAFKAFKYVNPYSSDLTGRFMNLRELSHRFKDSLTTPITGEILTSVGITNASLSGLPIELKLKILRKLEARDVARVAQTCREFRGLAMDLRR